MGYTHILVLTEIYGMKTKHVHSRKKKTKNIKKGKKGKQKNIKKYGTIS